MSKVVDAGEWTPGRSITRVVVDIHWGFAVIRYAGLAGEDVVRNNRAPHFLTQLDLRLVGLKLAAPNQDRAARDLQRVATSAILHPLISRRIRQLHRPGLGPHRAIGHEHRTSDRRPWAPPPRPGPRALRG